MDLRSRTPVTSTLLPSNSPSILPPDKCPARSPAQSMGCVPRPPATGSPDPSRGGTPEKRLELPPVDLLNRKKERVSEQKDPWRTSPWALLHGAFACVLGV